MRINTGQDEKVESCPRIVLVRDRGGRRKGGREERISMKGFQVFCSVQFCIVYQDLSLRMDNSKRHEDSNPYCTGKRQEDGEGKEE